MAHLKCLCLVYLSTFRSCYTRQIIHDPEVIFNPSLSAISTVPTSPSIPNPMEADADVVGDGVVGLVTPEHIWVRQRQDETVFLVPEKNAAAEDRASTICEAFLEEDEEEDRDDWASFDCDEEVRE